MNINFCKEEDLGFLANYDFRENSEMIIKQNFIRLKSSYTHNITYYNLKDSIMKNKVTTCSLEKKKTNQES